MPITPSFPICVEYISVSRFPLIIPTAAALVLPVYSLIWILLGTGPRSGSCSPFALPSSQRECESDRPTSAQSLPQASRLRLSKRQTPAGMYEVRCTLAPVTAVLSLRCSPPLTLFKPRRPPCSTCLRACALLPWPGTLPVSRTLSLPPFLWPLGLKSNSTTSPTSLPPCTACPLFPVLFYPRRLTTFLTS